MKGKAKGQRKVKENARKETMEKRREDNGDMLHLQKTRTHIDNLLLQYKRQEWKRTQQRLSTLIQQQSNYQH
eukprot:6108812-Amphidinium_carterae.2